MNSKSILLSLLLISGSSAASHRHHRRGGIQRGFRNQVQVVPLHQQHAGVTFYPSSLQNHLAKNFDNVDDFNEYDKYDKFDYGDKYDQFDKYDRAEGTGYSHEEGYYNNEREGDSDDDADDAADKVDRLARYDPARNVRRADSLEHPNGSKYSYEDVDYSNHADELDRRTSRSGGYNKRDIAAEVEDSFYKANDDHPESHYSNEGSADPEEDAEIDRYIESIKKSATHPYKYGAPSKKTTQHESDEDFDHLTNHYDGHKGTYGYGDSDYDRDSTFSGKYRNTRRSPYTPSDKWTTEMRRQQKLGDGTTWYDY